MAEYQSQRVRQIVRRFLPKDAPTGMIDPAAIAHANIRAQNAASKFTKSCSGSGCNCEAHREYFRLSKAIEAANRFPQTIQSQVDAIEDELRKMKQKKGANNRCQK